MAYRMPHVSYECRWVTFKETYFVTSINLRWRHVEVEEIILMAKYNGVYSRAWILLHLTSRDSRNTGVRNCRFAVKLGRHTAQQLSASIKLPKWEALSTHQCLQYHLDLDHNNSIGEMLPLLRLENSKKARVSVSTLSLAWLLCLGKLNWNQHLVFFSRWWGRCNHECFYEYNVTWHSNNWCVHYLVTIDLWLKLNCLTCLEVTP